MSSAATPLSAFLPAFNLMASSDSQIRRLNHTSSSVVTTIGSVLNATSSSSNNDVDLGLDWIGQREEGYAGKGNRPKRAVRI